MHKQERQVVAHAAQILEADDAQPDPPNTDRSLQVPDEEGPELQNPDEHPISPEEEIRGIDVQGTALVGPPAIMDLLSQDQLLRALIINLDELDKSAEEVVHLDSLNNCFAEMVENLTKCLGEFLTSSLYRQGATIVAPRLEYIRHKMVPANGTVDTLRANFYSNGTIQLEAHLLTEQDVGSRIWPPGTSAAWIRYGHFTDDLRLKLARRRLTSKSRGEAYPPVVRSAPEERVRLHERAGEVAPIPGGDIRRLPSLLIHADKKEQIRLLRGLHERFYHAGPVEMIRLLEAALLPREIAILGAEVARDCADCAKYARPQNKPKIKSHLCTYFNQVMQYDLFFLWNQTFSLMIDECTRWKMACWIPDKKGPTLTKNILEAWIRYWGPPACIASDQEGGLLSEIGSQLFDRLNIKRVLVGEGGYTTKGLVERHVGLVKHTMMVLKSSCEAQGLEVDYPELAAESAMSHNLMLDYAGGTPQTAATGQHPRELYDLESDSLSTISGALEPRPDVVERALRLRLMAKQAVLTSVVQDRLAQAAKTRIQKHPQELLRVGMIVDIWKEPGSKSSSGWRGPAELVSVQ